MPDHKTEEQSPHGTTICNHIGHVENIINGNVTTFHNHHIEGETKKAKTSTEEPLSSAVQLQRQMEIMQYVSNLKEFVAKDWRNRYETLWRNILENADISHVIYNPGQQKNTTFNRNLVANIIYIMCKMDVITETNATRLTMALEGNKESSVRAQLAVNPNDTHIKNIVEQILQKP